MTSLPLPTLFVSHGAPLFAMEPGQTGPALRSWAQSLPTESVLRGIVIMSPHWMSRIPAVMGTAQPLTWHDFGGFPAALYALQYPAPGSPMLAAEVLGLLRTAGTDAVADNKRPLDHGAWVPLMHLFPDANVPVVQVALPVGWGPVEVYAMGSALHGLRGSGVLLVGSGSMTHNLGEFRGDAQVVEPYVTEFSRWIESMIQQGDTGALLQYRERAPHALRAHPSDDHLLPLFFALGAAGAKARPTYLSREVMYGMLAMDTFVLS